MWLFANKMLQKTGTGLDFAYGLRFVTTRLIEKGREDQLPSILVGRPSQCPATGKLRQSLGSANRSSNVT